MIDDGAGATPVSGKAPASTARRVLQGVVSLGLVVAIFVLVLPQVADLSEVWDEVRAMTAFEVTTLSVVALWNLVSYAFVWMACLPGLTFPQAVVAAEAPTALANTVPAGSYLSIGLTYGMFHSWGSSRSKVTLALLVSGIWNNFAKLGLPVLALALLALEGGVSAARVLAGLGGIGALLMAIALFALALRSDAMAARIGNRAAAVTSWFVGLAGRPPVSGWDLALVRFRAKTIDLLGARWRLITVATVVSHLSLFLVLFVALRHIGVSQQEVTWVQGLAAFSFTRLVTAIPLTPGGVGVVELALTGALVTAGGDRPELVAAVLVYRFLTYVLPVPIGALAYVVWRRNRRWRKPASPSEASSPVLAAG
ncbi:lysylphosphatidylglycerol synthase domain-containing protein [soil metagenome]